MQSQPPTLLCRYGYDPLDRLTSHMLPGTPERQRFYCKSRLATEIQGSTKHSIVQHGDLLLAQRHVGDESLDTMLLVTDEQRSVLHTIKENNRRQSVAYSPYGHRHPENGLISLLGFNGERLDSVTDHYLLGNGYRAFNPVLMRFNSPDSLSPFGKGGLNPYTYCLGDPINFHDPSGNIALPKPLAKAFKKFLSTIGAKGKTYMKGPERLISTRKHIHEYEVYSDGRKYWHESTTLHIDNKLTSLHSTASYRDGIILDSNNGVVIEYKSTPNLRELAYSQIPGETLATYYRKFDVPTIDPTIDKINYNNALSSQIKDLKEPSKESKIMFKTFNKLATTGELAGVRPSVAKKIIRSQK